MGVGVGGVGVTRDREAVRVAERSRRVAVLDDVVLRLGAGRVARHPARLAEPRETVAPTGDELVDVRLVAGVPHEGVARRLEDPVQRERELDRPEVGAEVAAVRGNRVDQDRADLRRKLLNSPASRCCRSAGLSMLSRSTPSYPCVHLSSRSGRG